MTQRVDHLSPVEQAALADSPFDVLYPPTEKLPAIVVDNFPALGRLAAMRFLEWVQGNPEGVVSLPTGKTPEHFIKWVGRLLSTWDTPETRAILEEAKVDPSRRPRMEGLHFVQIDEFYPIHPTQHNSFFHYVNKYYIDGFGLDRSKALLIDCSRIGAGNKEPLQELWPEMTVDLSLRVRQATTSQERRQKDALARIDDWCLGYEEKVRDLGGIGFFLGGIGPDGHIGFNVAGSDHFSTTRLAPTNYETQAAAATDLGGIEIARNRHVITVGLGTIRYNTGCTVLVIAAGEAKAPIVAQAVQSSPTVLVPASALHGMPNARFYLTKGAASGLVERRRHAVATQEALSDEQVTRILVDRALASRKRLSEIAPRDLTKNPIASLLPQRRSEKIQTLCTMAGQRLENAAVKGATVAEGLRFLHTEPHHDDIMLGYLPAVVRHVRSARNVHYFATLTSGFSAVTNHYMVALLSDLREFMHGPAFTRLHEEGYFATTNTHARDRDVWQYLDGIAAQSTTMRREGVARRLLRNLMEIFDETGLSAVSDRVDELIHYFESEYPGKKDLPHIQQLKGMMREWEAECLWGYFGWSAEYVRHLRLGFYTGDIFSEEPTVGRDVPPILELLRESRPDVITLALDPEGSGPDTHYKVLQAIAEALRIYQKESGRDDLRVWGYRNVWYRFHPAEANVCVPVSLNMFSVMESAFLNTFVSQKDASFPSYEHDGPFCELAQRIQTEQYQALKTCLGREWFHENPSALIRATRGMVFLREMSLQELFEHCRALRKAAENA